MDAAGQRALGGALPRGGGQLHQQGQGRPEPDRGDRLRKIALSVLRAAGTLIAIRDKGVLERAGVTIRPTPRGKPAVEEIGYLYVP